MRDRVEVSLAVGNVLCRSVQLRSDPDNAGFSEAEITAFAFSDVFKALQDHMARSELILSHFVIEATEDIDACEIVQAEVDALHAAARAVVDKWKSWDERTKAPPGETPCEPS